MVFIRKMEEWLGGNVTLNSKHGSSKGRIAYGARMPMASQLIPFIECEHGSREKIEGERPSYYFVSEQHEGLKILLVIYAVDRERIKVIARSAGSIFGATLVKDYK